MKRDLDLARQLLLDIEARAADCSVSVLRATPQREISNGTAPHAIDRNSFEIDERIRYHLRLLIDGGYLREVDRTSAGVPCVRLTHEGHELIELSRESEIWDEAKCACQEHTGGLSLTVIRIFLIRMATGPREYIPRIRHHGYVRRPRYLSNGAERPLRNRVRYVRVRPMKEGFTRTLDYLADFEGDDRYDLEYESAFPSDLI